MKLSSPAFEDGQRIPIEYSRDDLDKSPPLHIEDVPKGTRSLALIMDDADARDGQFTHWVVFDLEPGVRCLPENNVPISAKFGANSWGEMAYGGPQPVLGEHAYVFRLYALDVKLGLRNGIKREEVQQAMQFHVLAEAILTGRFSAKPKAGEPADDLHEGNHGRALRTQCHAERHAHLHIAKSVRSKLAVSDKKDCA